MFFDDLLVTESEFFDFEVVESVVRNDVYIVIINRVDSPAKPDEIDVDYSINSILMCHTDGINHWFTKMIDSLPSSVFSSNVYDCIVAEDTHGSYTFAEKLFNLPIISAGGKDNILRCILKVIDDGFKNVFVFVDGAGYGRNLHEFVSYLSEIDEATVYFDRDYECFEYLLLVSNMLANEFVFDYGKANSYNSWEKYFEAELERLTEDKMYSYKHGRKVKDCYMVDCNNNCNNYKFAKCDKYTELNKIVSMFKGTIFEYLISMCDKYRK